MFKTDDHPSGRHFLQIPGPSPVPDRVLRAIGQQTIDHRGPEFGRLGLEVLAGIGQVFQTRQPVVIYASSGTGAWEAALVNCLSPGDSVLMYETGHFASLWSKLATRLGLEVEILTTAATDPVLPQAPHWRRGIDPDRIESRLRADREHRIKAICVVHNETSTGVTNDIASVREAIDAAQHPALLMVDSISGLGAADYRHDEWGVDVTIAGSQKGLMLPPGLGMNAVSAKAIEVSKSARLPKAYWGWDEIIAMNRDGYWPTTPNTNLLYGLAEVLRTMLAPDGQGLARVFRRHQRWAKASRAAVQAWGLEVFCAQPELYSPVLTGVITPEGVDADALRRVIHQRFDLSLGTGLGNVKGRMFRMGHLGDINDLNLIAMLAGVEMGMKAFGIALNASGVDAAMQIIQAEPAGMFES